MNGPRNTFHHGIADQLQEHAQSAVSSVQSPAVGNCTTGLSFSELHSLRPEFDYLLWLPQVPCDPAVPAYLQLPNTRVFRSPVDSRNSGTGGAHGACPQDNRGTHRRRGTQE
jgi:hypothetical protein